MRSASLFLACSIIASFGHTTLAGLVTWEFAGEITAVEDNISFFGDAITVGSPFTGTFTFESATPDSDLDSPRSGHYVDAATHTEGQVGDVSFFGLKSSSIYVWNDFFQGEFDAFIFTFETLVLGEYLLGHLSLRDNNAGIFSNDSLPLVPPHLEDIDRTSFTLSNAPQETLIIGGTISRIVPEPTTLALLGLGTSLVLVRRRNVPSKRL